MPEISFDWVWFEYLRDDFLALSERDRADLALRVAFISANPWPDFSSKTFFHVLPPELLQELVSSGSSWHLIVYADERPPYDTVNSWGPAVSPDIPAIGRSRCHRSPMMRLSCEVVRTYPPASLKGHRSE
jgi:hypothetical protein